MCSGNEPSSAGIVHYEHRVKQLPNSQTSYEEIELKCRNTSYRGRVYFIGGRRYKLLPLNQHCITSSCPVERASFHPKPEEVDEGAADNQRFSITEVPNDADEGHDASDALARSAEEEERDESLAAGASLKVGEDETSKEFADEEKINHQADLSVQLADNLELMLRDIPIQITGTTKSKRKRSTCSGKGSERIELPN